MLLLGRERECALIDHLLDEARLRKSAAIVIRGDPGVGKTALLDYAEAGAGSMRVLRATGVESESKLPFAALQELLLPVLDLLNRLPVAQSAALNAALAIGPSVGADRLAIGAAVLALLAEAAEDSALLCVIDDAHWIDSASAQAILFASRRLRAEGILVLMSVRERELSPFDAPGIPDLRVGGLDRDAALTLLTEHAVGLTADVRNRLIEVTRGNPLALIELPNALLPGQRTGRDPIVEPLPIGDDLQRAFLGRAGALSDNSQMALLVAAASDASDTRMISRALSALGLDLIDLETAESAGLVAISEGQISFFHPLVRSAIYRAAEPARRRLAHRTLAAASDERRSEARAWHLAAATTGPDEDVAATLERAAEDASSRGAPTAAARSYERAATFTLTDDERGRRLLAAASASWLAGQSAQALRQLEVALEAVHDARLRADIQWLRGRVLTWTSNVMTAHHLLVDEATAVAPTDRQRAAIMMSEAVVNCVMAAQIDRALEIARRAEELAADDEPTLLMLGVQAMALGLKGDPTARISFDRFQHAQDASPKDIDHMSSVIAQLLIRQEDWEFGAAATVLDRIVAARQRGIVNPFALAMRALSSFRRGQWASCYADATESVEIAQETGQQIALIHGLVTLARVEATTGREPACREHTAQAHELIVRLGVDSMLPVADAILGLLELGNGDPVAAVRQLEPVSRFVRARGIHSFGGMADLAEAYVRAGQIVHAADALSELDAVATRSERKWAHATAARCRGLIAAREFDADFQQALGWHGPASPSFERARTEFCYGERLRRAGRRVDSRAQLRSALATFEVLGAEPWAEQTRAELRATGERLERRRTPASSRLTGQELQVALLVAAGGTNREVGARLMLSPRTIEFHLGKIYAKLGVRSRTELAHRVAVNKDLT